MHADKIYVNLDEQLGSILSTWMNFDISVDIIIESEMKLCNKKIWN